LLFVLFLFILIENTFKLLFFYWNVLLDEKDITGFVAEHFWTEKPDFPTKMIFFYSEKSSLELNDEFKCLN